MPEWTRGSSPLWSWEVWGVPEGVSGQVLWDIINGTLLLLDSSGGNNDFQSLIKRVV